MKLCDVAIYLLNYLVVTTFSWQSVSVGCQCGLLQPQLAVNVFMTTLASSQCGYDNPSWLSMWFVTTPAGSQCGYDNPS